VETTLTIPQEQQQPRVQQSSLNETDKVFIRIGAYTVGSVLLLTGLFLGGRHIYRKYQQDHAAKKTLTDDSAENFATRIQMALFGSLWGANVELIREIFNQIPSQQEFAAIAVKYGDITKSNKSQIYLDLKKKLTEQEFYEMQNILVAKPAKNGQKATFDMKAATAMAKRIKSAFDYTWMGMDGTDKKALKQALLDIPTLKDFAMVMVAYKQLYKTDLTSDLDSELDAFDFSWKDIVYTKPKY
jgi:hypothetical protein